MAKKAVKVKWSIGADEPGDLAEFLSNDDILKKNKRKFPGKGPFTFKVKRLSMKPNRNGDDRVAVMLVLDEPKKSDAASWNNYMIMDGFNITEQGTPFLKRFLKGLGLSWNDFYEKTKGYEDNDRTIITQIGRVKFGEDATKDPTVRATVKVLPADDYNDDEHMEIARYLPLQEDVEPDDEETEEDEDEVATFDAEADEDEDEDEEDDDEDDEEEEDDEDDEDEEELTIDSLKSKPIAELRDIALEYGVKQKKIDAAGKKKSVLVDLIAKKADIAPF